MIKRFHEAPKSIFTQVQKVTDGDYALVNLFDSDEEYYKMFKKAVQSGREVILDNGVFELGKAWNADEYASWIDNLQPTFYIVPDVLEDCDSTIQSFYNFTERYKNLPGKIMGVAQGSSYKELVRCYKELEPLCDKVCIGFDFSWYSTIAEEDDAEHNRFVRAYVGRMRTLGKMADDGVINKSKPHHLLGVMLPQEMKVYSSLQRSGSFKWIDSVDTSNPVVHGLKGIEYTCDGLQYKESQKLYTLINMEVGKYQFDCIIHNIEMFRRFCA